MNDGISLQCTTTSWRILENFINIDFWHGEMRFFINIELIIHELWHASDSKNGKNQNTVNPVHSNATEKNRGFLKIVSGAKSMRFSFSV